MKMTRVERFTMPSSFEEVDLSEGKCPLDLRDVSKSRKELWLIRAPLGFDGSSLNDVTLNLDGESVEFSYEKGDGKKYEALSLRQLQENEAQSPYLLLPSQEEKKLTPGPAFKGQIVIMESLSLPTSSHALPEIHQSEAPRIPEGLRQRFKPFGCEKPWQGEGSPSPPPQKSSSSSSSSKKEKLVEDKPQTGAVLDQMPVVSGVDPGEGRIMHEEIEPDPENRKKMKKAKRKHEKKGVAEEDTRSEDTDDVEDDNPETSPRKKKKKKRSKDK